VPIISGGGAAFNGGTITNTLAIHPGAGNPGLVIVGVDGGSTKLIDASALHSTFTVDSDGGFVFSSDDGAGLTVHGVGNSANLSVSDDRASSNAVSMSTSVAAAAVNILPQGTAVTGFRQQNTLGDPVLETRPIGLVILTHAAPADGTLAAGECAFWFDQTDGVGNTKLMVKGKSADGTVKSGTVVLA
jgi:hypothetical protein